MSVQATVRTTFSNRHVASARATLLLIEDDVQIQTFLAPALKAHGHALVVAGTGTDGLRLAALHQPDMVIVDLNLPGADRTEVIRRLRECYVQPIVVISESNREADKIVALDNGADDYITKPFWIGELLARLRVAERHIARRNGVQEMAARIEIGALSIDLAARRVQLHGTDLHLTPIEYRLLTTLARHRGKVLTHRQILREIWGAAHIDSPHYLRIYVRALRLKIEPDPSRPRYLVTEMGVGYQLVAGVSTEQFP
jgi:two-component system KDP operon response regulator KdpE